MTELNLKGKLYAGCRALIESKGELLADLLIADKDGYMHPLYIWWDADKNTLAFCAVCKDQVAPFKRSTFERTAMEQLAKIEDGKYNEFTLPTPAEVRFDICVGVALNEERAFVKYISNVSNDLEND